MDGPEGNAWTSLQRRMRSLWDAQRHEDKYTSGIADVSWAARGVDGWIEMKAIRSWPIRVSTPVSIGLEKHQAEWLVRRGSHGAGLVYVLVRVEREWLLFHWTSARDLARKRYTTLELIDRTIGYWPSRFDPDEFLTVITGGR